MISFCLMNTIKAVFPQSQKKYFHHPHDTSWNLRAGHLNFLKIFLHLHGNDMFPKTYLYPVPTSTPKPEARKFLQLIPDISANSMPTPSKTHVRHSSRRTSPSCQFKLTCLAL